MIADARDWGKLKASNINAAIADAASQGISALQLPGENITCDEPIDINVDRVTLLCAGATSWVDGGSHSPGTRFVKDFHDAPLVRIRSPYGAGNSKKRGAGIVGGMLDGANRRGRVLEIDSVANVTVNAYVTGATDAAAAVMLRSGVSFTDLAEACDLQDSDIRLRVRQIDGAAQQAVHCVKAEAAGANGNVSQIAGGPSLHLTCQHANGRAFYAKAMDNCFVTLRSTRIEGGGGAAIWAGGQTASDPVGCHANLFQQVSCNAPIYAEGTGDAGVTGGVTNIIRLDRANGSPSLLSGVGSRWVEIGQLGELVDHALARVGIGETAASALAARNAMGGESMRIRNGSAAHAIWEDAARRWLTRLAGDDFDILPLVASGCVNVGGLKINGVRFAADANGFLKVVP